MLVNGEEIPAYSYCPKDTILFDFKIIDPDMEGFKYYWVHNYDISDTIRDITPIKLTFPIISDGYKVYLYFVQPPDTIPFDTLMNTINIDFIRTELDDLSVCQGRDITVSTNTHGDITYYNVQSDIYTPWDTLQSASGCDSLVRWHITMEPYVVEEYAISSCDSVIWGDIIVKRPDNVEGDWETKIERMFYATDPDASCDTTKILTITIIDTAYLKIVFDQELFCNGDDMSGTLELETNLTAFDWRFEDVDKDSLWTEFVKQIEIEHSGWYYVYAYMDTSLYDTLKDLRIVNNCPLDAKKLVEDCDLIIPNIITPNGDGANDVFGIKKLNPKRPNELTIYDRWGKKVFHQKNYQCVFKAQAYINDKDAFAGFTTGGQELPDGTYTYAFKYAAIPKTKKYTGALVILR